MGRYWRSWAWFFKESFVWFERVISNAAKPKVRQNTFIEEKLNLKFIWRYYQPANACYIYVEIEPYIKAQHKGTVT